MTWLQIVTLLACPIMMLICMRGMFGRKDCHNTSHGKQVVSLDDVQKLQNKIAELAEQNQILMKELQIRKNLATQRNPFSGVWGYHRDTCKNGS
jgi:hypothetical protein